MLNRFFIYKIKKTIVLNVLTKSKAKGIYCNLPSGIFVCAFLADRKL